MENEKLGSLIKGNKILLLLIPQAKISAKRSEILKNLESDSGGVGVLSFNQPYSTLSQSLSKVKVNMDKLYFVDVLSSGVYSAKKSPNCTFISSPEDITEISLTLSQLMKTGEIDTFFIESFSTLLVYRDSLTVIQFAHSVINKARIAGTRLILTAVKEDANTELVKDLHMFVDNVIEVD